MSEIADKIRELSCWLKGTDIELLELALGKDIIRLRRETSNQCGAPLVSGKIGTVSFDIPAPSVGVFRHTYPLRTAPLVQVGQRVMAGDSVGLLQIGALLVHVVAPSDGTILELLAKDGSAVGYGTALMRFRGNG